MIRRRPRRGAAPGAAAVLVLAAVAVGLAACSGDDDVEATDAFCDARVEFEAVLSVETPAEDDIDEALNELTDTAPPELAEPVATLTDTVRNRPDEAFATDEFHAAQNEVDEVVVANCGYPAYDVTATEYSFEGVPSEVPAGTVAFTMANDGELEHELAIFRIDDSIDAPVGELLRTSPARAAELMTFTNAAHATAGATNTSVADLEPGRYAAVCIIPSDDTGAPHYAEGMFTEFTVR